MFVMEPTLTKIVRISSQVFLVHDLKSRKVNDKRINLKEVPKVNIRYLDTLFYDKLVCHCK